MSQALISLDDPDYGSPRWQKGLMTMSISIAVSSFNAFAAGNLSLLEGFFALCHVFALVPIMVSLWVLAEKHELADVFLNFKTTNETWSSLSLSVLTGQSTAFFTVLGSEAVVHISEEIEHPEAVVPRCMLWSFLSNIPVTILCLVTYLVNLGSVDLSIDQAQTPIITVFETAFKDAPEATTGFAIVILLLLVMIATSTMVATSRHLFAFGRDRAMLFSAWISRVNSTLQVPLNAILCTTFFTIVVVAATVQSQVALRIYITLSTACLHGTYITSIACLIWRRLYGEKLPHAKWSLGRAGLWVNLIGLVYACWACFWSFWPTYQEVTPKNYNWVVLLFFAVLVLALVAYTRGVKRRRRQQEAEHSSLLSPET